MDGDVYKLLHLEVFFLDMFLWVFPFKDFSSLFAAAKSSGFAQANVAVWRRYDPLC